jgi:hypothetical protein
MFRKLTGDVDVRMFVPTLRPNGAVEFTFGRLACPTPGPPLVATLNSTTH